MKKLITIVLALAIGTLFSTTAFAKDMKTAQTTKPATPVIDNHITGNNNTMFPNEMPSILFVGASGAVSTDQKYRFYYADYNNDERQITWKWLKENGKILTQNPYLDPNDKSYLKGDTMLKVDQYGKKQVFTVTIVDKNGNESDPAPIRVF